MVDLIESGNGLRPGQVNLGILILFGAEGGGGGGSGLNIRGIELNETIW